MSVISARSRPLENFDAGLDDVTRSVKVDIFPGVVKFVWADDDD
jgi:hypothetical protein